LELQQEQQESYDNLEARLGSINTNLQGQLKNNDSVMHYLLQNQRIGRLAGLGQVDCIKNVVLKK
jgi:hypothetical protein